MFVIKRNQVIVTALVVMIAVAGYLNFTETKVSQSGETALLLNEEGDSYATLNDDGSISTLADNDPKEENLDVAKAVGGEIDPITAEIASESNGDGAAVFVNAEANAGTDPNESVTTSTAPAEGAQFFVQAKLDREQARAKQKDILTEMINNGNVEGEQKAACADNMLELQKKIEKETAAEAMIEAKGFKEAYVRIDDETVDVVVDKEKLTDAEIAQIEDIVKRKTGFAEDKIRISPLKK